MHQGVAAFLPNAKAFSLAFSSLTISPLSLAEAITAPIQCIFVISEVDLKLWTTGSAV